MGRIIKTGSAGKDRLLLQKGIILAIRELSKQESLNESTQDLVAFIALSLKSIGETIDQSVEAWEKRGYWLKADRYRMEWNWTTNLAEELIQSALNDDWSNVAKITAVVFQNIGNVKLPQRNTLGQPWIGSWKKIKNQI